MSKLSVKQWTKLTSIRNNCHLYNATRLRTVVNEYIDNHQLKSESMRRQHDNMIEYFEELLNLTASNVLPK